MAERIEDVRAHWTRPGVLARIDAALTEVGRDPQNLSPEILATVGRSAAIAGSVSYSPRAQRYSIVTPATPTSGLP